MFTTLLDKITSVATMEFSSATDALVDYIDSTKGFIDILEQIGTIPESIPHDSTEEKLFAKSSDAVLARAFREIGLKSSVMKERADSADVLVESFIFGYTMVADAKAFRMSRTAKNQKDFKVVALSGWRKDADYAVLCSPYFHYPKSQSQIYAQSIDHNVCLLSWEHLIFMIKNDIRENEQLNLSKIWDFSELYSHEIVVADKKKCFLVPFSNTLVSTVALDSTDFNDLLTGQIIKIADRGEIETGYWKKEKVLILSYTKEQAIEELIKSKKIDEKVSQIERFIKGVRND